MVFSLCRTSSSLNSGRVSCPHPNRVIRPTALRHPLAFLHLIRLLWQPFQLQKPAPRAPGGFQMTTASDQLRSWNDTATTQAIVEFVESTVRDVPPEERVAVFDNDGTLWCEKPMPI